MKEDKLNQHNDCSVSIRWKLFKNQEFPTPGLFCCEHDHFLGWLTSEVAYELIDSGVKEELYLDRSQRPSEVIRRERGVYRQNLNDQIKQLTKDKSDMLLLQKLKEEREELVRQDIERKNQKQNGN